MMNPAITSLSLIDFIADRYGIDLLESYSSDSIEYRRHRLSGPECREKLMLLKRLHRHVGEQP